MNRSRALKKGEAGEALVSKLLSSSPDFHYLINNLILLGDNGVSHQIDHIYISKEGVFVLETKNYFGEILGKEEDSFWLRKYVRQGKKVVSTFTNPIKQNKSHIKAVRRIIGKDINLYGFIVFVQANEQDINLFNVVNPNNLLERIKLLTCENLLSTDTIEKIYQTLLNSEANVSDLTHIDNVKTVNRSRKENQAKLRLAIENKICPDCNGVLQVEQSTLKCANCHKIIKL